MKTNHGELTTDSNRAVGQLLTELLESCPVCRRGLSGHKYTLLATSVVPNEKDNVLLGFFDAIKGHQWLKLREYQTWLGKTDNVEAYAISCSGSLTVVVIKTHFELLQGARLLYSEALSAEEGVALGGAFTNLQWHEF